MSDTRGHVLVPQGVVRIRTALLGESKDLVQVQMWLRRDGKLVAKSATGSTLMEAMQACINEFGPKRVD